MKTAIKFLLPFLLALVLTRCSDIHRASQKTECADLFKGIEDHFRYEEESRLYSMRKQEDGYDLIFHMLRNESCLVGLSDRSIEKLFGAPSRSTEKGFFYYLVPNCWKNKEGVGPHECIQLVFKFDGEGRVKEFFVT